MRFYCLSLSSIVLVSKYSFVSSANSFMVLTMFAGISLMYSKNRTGPRMLPWGATLVASFQLENYPSSDSLCSAA